MKWIGQHIWDFISRFRSDVYLESVESGTIASGGNLGLDANNKIVKADTESGELSFDGSTANGILTYKDADEISVESTFTYDSITGARLSSSLAGNYPFFQMSNSHSDASGPLFKFENTANGADDDFLGTIIFNGEDDGGGEHTFAKIVAQIGTALATDEAGKLRLEVAASNDTTSNSRQALTATGHGTSDIVNVDLGYGVTSTTTIAGDLDIDGDTITSAGDLTITPNSGGGGTTINSPLITVNSSAISTLNLNNTADDAVGPIIQLSNSRGGADADDNDKLGTINFTGLDDGTPSTQTYGSIICDIADATSGQEAGRLRFYVAEYDGTSNTIGLELDGDTDADGEIDVTIGAGAASTTTIAGTLTMGSTAAMTNAGLLSVANQSNITGLGTISSGAWQGTAIADAYVANDLTISGGTVNNSVIGGTTPAAITGTTVDATTDFTVGTTVITDDQIQFTPSTDDTVTIAAGSSGALNITTVDTAGRNAELNITADGIISTISSASQINTTYDFHSTTFENLMTAGKPSGKILRYSPATDATLTAGQVYYLRNTGSWLQADADSTSTSTVLLGLGLGGSSQTVGVMIEGFMRIPTAEILNTPTNVDGQPVYLSTTTGHLDFTAPSGSNDVVRILGYAIDDHLGDVLIYFNPDRTWIEIA